MVKNGALCCPTSFLLRLPLHTLYGGVVPELASVNISRKINQVITQALTDADMTLDDMDAIAAPTVLAWWGRCWWAWRGEGHCLCEEKTPLVGVHHIEDIYSANFIENKELEPPFICLVVSGGHTHLVVVKIMENTRS